MRPRFLDGGGFYVKHPWWGSLLTNSKGRELYKRVSQYNLNVLPAGSATYWLTDLNKTPVLTNFAIYSGINPNHLQISNNEDMSPDHSALVINMTVMVTSRSSFSNLGYSPTLT